MSTAYPSVRCMAVRRQREVSWTPVVAARFCAAVLEATRPVRDSLFVPSFCSLIPAGSRVCQHPIRDPVEPISTLNSSDRVSVPVVDCVRELFVDLERRVRRTKLEGVITCSLWAYRRRSPVSLLATLWGTRNKAETNSCLLICGRLFADKGVKSSYWVCQACLGFEERCCFCISFSSPTKFQTFVSTGATHASGLRFEYLLNRPRMH